MIDRIAKCVCDCFNYPTYRENLKTFDDRKICSAGLLPPTGRLKKKGWIIKMSFEKLPSGSDILKQLINYVSVLNENYPKNRFRRFARLT